MNAAKKSRGRWGRRLLKMFAFLLVLLCAGGAAAYVWGMGYARERIHDELTSRAAARGLTLSHGEIEIDLSGKIAVHNVQLTYGDGGIAATISQIRVESTLSEMLEQKPPTEVWLDGVSARAEFSAVQAWRSGSNDGESSGHSAGPDGLAIHIRQFNVLLERDNRRVACRSDSLTLETPFDSFDGLLSCRIPDMGIDTGRMRIALARTGTRGGEPGWHVRATPETTIRTREGVSFGRVEASYTPTHAQLSVHDVALSLGQVDLGGGQPPQVALQQLDVALEAQEQGWRPIQVRGGPGQIRIPIDTRHSGESGEGTSDDDDPIPLNELADELEGQQVVRPEWTLIEAGLRRLQQESLRALSRLTDAADSMRFEDIGISF
ncbi:MAG: hypothetical protein KC561_08965, partial [Myxococcales bacterium]|nr:hypothetical protein [Myxococcales bacterium]